MNRRMSAIGWLMLVFGVVFFGGSAGFYIADMKGINPAGLFAIVAMLLCLVLSVVVGILAVVRASRPDRVSGYERMGSSRPAAESGMSILTDYFGPVLVDKSNDEHTLHSVLADKFVGIYIGAGWDKSAEVFERTLIELHGDVNGRTPQPTFEIVYVSADRSEEEFRTAISHFPFLAMPFTDLVRRKRLMTLFRAELLPRFLLLSPTGERLTDDEEWVRRDPYGQQFPWRGSSSANANSEKNCIVQ